jgi:hypothetical protein
MGFGAALWQELVADFPCPSGERVKSLCGGLLVLSGN